MIRNQDIGALCETKRAGVALDAVEADGTFSGYASLFGAIDLGNDVVERGAFARSLTGRGAAGIRMLYQHNPAEPIGRWLEIREDARGLFVRGLIAGTDKGREVLALMREGALDGLSIGYRTVRARKDAKGGVRRILEADLWEISVVTFPMLPGARVAQVKTCRGLPTTRQFERWLTRDAGLSRSDARAVIAKGFASLRRERDAAGLARGALAERIRDAALTINLRG